MRRDFFDDAATIGCFDFFRCIRKSDTRNDAGYCDDNFFDHNILLLCCWFW